MTFLCFICSSTVNAETNEETREKYKDVIGINLSPESQLCYICCHLLNKLSHFKSLCLRRSLEYPVLLSKKWPLDLQKSDSKIEVLCPNECHDQQTYNNSNYQFQYKDNSDDTDCNDARYVKLEHDVFNDYYESNKDLYCMNDSVTESLSHNDLKEEATKINNQYQNDKLNHNKIIDNDINANFKINVDDKNTYDDSINDHWANTDNDMDVDDRNKYNELNNVNCFNTENHIDVDNRNKYDNSNNDDWVNTENTLDVDNRNKYDKSNNDDWVNTENHIDVVNKNKYDKSNNDDWVNTENHIDVVIRNKYDNSYNDDWVNTENHIDVVNRNKYDKSNNVNWFKTENNIDVVNRNKYDNSNNDDWVNTENHIDVVNRNKYHDNDNYNATDNCVYEDVNPDMDNTEIDKGKSESYVIKKNKGKVSDKGYKRIILSVEQQKAELEANRKKKKYIEAEFKCYNCALDFLFKDTYQAHMMRHEESNGEYQCTACTLRFATVASLRIHRACHAERHICRKCGACLRPRAKRRHACFKPTHSQSVACHLCGNLLKDADGLQQHLKRVHASKANGRQYACSVCGESYTRQGALRTHMIKHINRKFHCDICSSTYSSPYTLTEHKKSHQSGGLSHYCNTCGAGYATRKSLLAHLRNTSNHQTTTFECPICSRVCPNKKSLASHVQSVHSDTRDYTCDACPARYTNRKSLVRHAGAHSRKLEVKMVICHLCGGYFKGNSKLNRHIRNVCNKAKEEQMSLYQ